MNTNAYNTLSLYLFGQVSPFITCTDLSQLLWHVYEIVFERRFNTTYFIVLWIVLQIDLIFIWSCYNGAQERDEPLVTPCENAVSTVAMQVPGAHNMRWRQTSQWGVHSKLAALAQLLSLIIDPLTAVPIYATYFKVPYFKRTADISTFRK